MTLLNISLLSSIMKKYINLIIITLITIISLSAEVRFDLRFLDKPGIGFNAEGNEWMKEAVIDAADCLGKTIKQHAFVTIAVYHDPDNNIFAYDTQLLKKIESKQANVITRAMNEILHNEFSGFNNFNGIWEGEIQFNTNRFSDFKSLKSTAIHELTHTLGFISIYPDAQYKSFNFFNEHTNFDHLISDKHGNPLLIENLGWISNYFKLNPQFDFKSEIFACGPNIKHHNDGKCVKLYNPKTYEKGSSFSHLDTETYPRNLLNHRRNDGYTIWNKYEIGIMQDLGLEIDWENYCKIVKNEAPNRYHLFVDLDVLEKNLKEELWFFTLSKPSEKLFNDYPQECPNNPVSYDNVWDRSFECIFEEGDVLTFFINNTYFKFSLTKESDKVLFATNILGNDYLLKFDATSDSDSLKLTFVKEPSKEKNQRCGNKKR